MLDLGVDCAFGGTRAVGYVERDSFAAAVLVERMEDEALECAPVWAGDLATFPWSDFHGLVDIVAAGFPCQPHSVAGSRGGVDDERWIWPDIAAGIRALRPGFVVLENVPGLRSSGGLAPVLGDLAASGYRVAWTSLRASDVGASHQRERVFIVGVADTGCADDERRRERGDVHRPTRAQQGEGLQRQRHGDTARDGGADVADASRPGPQGRERRSAPDGGLGPAASGPTSELRPLQLFAPGPDADDWLEIIRRAPHLAPATQPGVRCVVDGHAVVVDASRADQLRAIGNGVVALQAAVAVRFLLRILGV